jgi:hypothetical protein
MISRTPAQRVLSAESLSDDFSKFGIFERNVYARPADQALVVEHAIRNRWRQAYDLDGRRAVTGQEAGSRTSAVRLPPYSISARGPDLVPDGDFATAPREASCWSAAGNGEMIWVKDKLDGGCLHHRYKFPAADPTVSVLMLRASALSAGKSYLLKFTVQGSAENGSAGVRLREWDRPWQGLTDYQDVKVDPTRRECELLFTVQQSKSASQIEWIFNQRDGTLWLDNVSLQEVSVTEPDPRIFRFEFNPTEQPKRVRLEQAWVDVDGKGYTGELVLPPRASLVLIRKDALR